ncbi:MAG: class I SAM-dependent methyltransferase [Bacteroidales bacterium]|jgi:O-methyltransferase involved in polyketide biosynthesis
MTNSHEINLGSVQETMLLPLWGRAVETQKQKPLLVDNKAVSIIESIPYDFTTISNNIRKLTRASWIARSIFFDKKISEFIKVNPFAIVVNVGCGLDTTFDRIDNGKINWIDLDLPDAIELRKQYFQETDRRRFIAKSVFDTSWYGDIKNKDKVMLLIAGVLYYFDEPNVKKLFNDIHNYLPASEIIFDHASKLGIKLSNEQVIKRGGMNESAYLKWGIDDIFEIGKWESYINVISNMPMYKEHKKNYPITKRIGMNISDSLKIMSLAHIKIT